VIVETIALSLAAKFLIGLAIGGGTITGGSIGAVLTTIYLKHKQGKITKDAVINEIERHYDARRVPQQRYVDKVLDEAHTHLATLRTDTGKQTQALATVTDNLAQHADLIADEVVALNDLIATLTGTIGERDSQLVLLVAQLEEQQRQLSGISQSLSQSQQQLTQKEMNLTTAYAEIESISQQLKAKQSPLLIAHQDLNTLRSEIEQLTCFVYTAKEKETVARTTIEGLATDLQCALQLIREQQAQIDGYQQQLIATINPERHSRFFK
jgi:chromosome segregation ATPase